jgi:vancomycin resistance protein YoaR
LPIPSEFTLDFNKHIGPYNAKEGYLPATVLVDGGSKQGYGGGTCQVSSTLYNVVLQLPGLYVIQRRAHGGNGASYLPIGVDAAVGNSSLNFRFRNKYPFPIRIDASSQDGALTIAIYRAE